MNTSLSLSCQLSSMSLLKDDLFFEPIYTIPGMLSYLYIFIFDCSFSFLAMIALFILSKIYLPTYRQCIKCEN